MSLMEARTEKLVQTAESTEDLFDVDFSNELDQNPDKVESTDKTFTTSDPFSRKELSKSEEIAKFEKMFDLGLDINNPIYTNDKKAKDLVEANSKADPLHVRIDIGQNVHGREYIEFKKDDIPKNMEDLLSRDFYTQNGRIGTIGIAVNSANYEKIENQLKELNEKYVSINELKTADINQYYKNFGCTREDLIKLAINPDLDLKQFESKIIDNQLITQDMMNTLFSSYKNYILETKYAKEYESLSLKEKVLESMRLDPNPNAREIDKFLVDFTHDKKKLNEKVDAYFKEQVLNSLVCYYEPQLDNKDLYKIDGATGKTSKVLSFFSELRAKAALKFSFLKDTFDTTTKYDSLTKIQFGVLKILNKVTDPSFLKKIGGYIKEIKVVKSITKFLEDKWKPFLENKFLDKLKGMESLSLNSIIDVISRRKGEISEDKKIQKTVFKNNMMSVDNIKSKLLETRVPEKEYIFDKKLNEVEAFTMFKDCMNEVFRNANFIQEVISKRDEDGKKILSDERTSELTFLERKNDLLIHEIYSSDLEVSLKNAQTLSDQYAENALKGSYSGSPEMNKLMASIDKYETMVQYLKLYPALEEKYKHKMELEAEGKDPGIYELTAEEREVVLAVTNGSSWVNNEQLYLFSMQPFLDFLKGQNPITTMLKFATICNFPLFVFNAAYSTGKFLLNSNTFTQVSLDYELLKATAESCLSEPKYLGV